MATEAELIKDQVENGRQLQSRRAFVRPDSDDGFPPLSDDEAAQQPTVQDTAQIPELSSAEDAKKLARLLKERGREGVGDQYPKFLEMLKRYDAANPAGSIPQDNVVRTPRAVGTPAIDRAGEHETGAIQMGPAFGGAIPTGYTRPELVTESSEGRKRDAGQRGIDFTHGAPFGARLAQAATINTPPEKAQALQVAMDEEAGAAAQAGLPLLQWDEDLGMLTYYRQITQADVQEGSEAPESLGKFRQTIIDEEGFGLGDLGDLFNLGEIGSIIGSVSAIGKGKLAFWKSTGRQAGGGVAGREAGNLVGLAIHKLRGGDTPSAEHLIGLVGGDIALEVATSFLGEGAARTIVAPAIKGAKNLAARADGKRLAPASMTAEDVAKENAFREQTRQTLQDVADSTDGKLLHTSGETTGRQSTLIQEADNAAAFTAKAKRAENRRHQNNQQVRQQYIQTRLGGNMPAGSTQQTVAEARDAVYEGSRISLVADQSGDIYIKPHAMRNMRRVAEGAEHLEVEGMHLVDDGVSWNMKGLSDFEDLQGIGLGAETYQAAALEARAHGRGLTSDWQLTNDAYKQWQKLDGMEGVGKVDWNPRAVREQQEVFLNGKTVQKDVWVVRDANGEIIEGAHVASLKPIPDGVTKDLIRSSDPKLIRRPQLGSKTGNNLERFRRMPGRAELGVVKAETEGNTHLKSQMVDKLYENYQEHVAKNGFKMEKHNTWLKESKRTMENILTADEFSRVYGAPGNFRAFRDEMVNSAQRATNVLSTILKETGEDTFAKLNSTKDLLPQLRNLPPASFHRAIKVLRNESPETFQNMQSIVRDEMKDKLLALNEGNITKKGMKNLEKLLGTKDKRQFYSEMLGGQYVRDLNSFIHTARMDSARQGLKGQAAEAHPAGIMLARAIIFKNVFGRRQRIASAGQKFARQQGHSSMADVLSDPSKLRLLVGQGHNPVATSQGMAIMSRLGLAELAGVDNIEDPNTAARTFEQWAIGEIAEYRELLDL